MPSGQAGLREVQRGYRGKDLEAIKAHYAGDAVMILPGQAPFQGIDAIMGDYKAYAADPAGKYVSARKRPRSRPVATSLMVRSTTKARSPTRRPRRSKRRTGTI